MNFLQICQRVASESRTVSGVFPSTVASQTGRALKIVTWVQVAWESIQISRSDWRWMESDFTGSTIANQREYSGSDVGVSERFNRFLCTLRWDEDRFSIYDPDIGVADEGQLEFWSWRDFYVEHMRGTQTTGKPHVFTIRPDGRMALSQVPDKAYTLRGPYMKSPQTLAADGDEPEMPSQFHELIVDIALDYLDTHDEGMERIPLVKLRSYKRFSALEREQLPPVEIAGALA